MEINSTNLTTNNRKRVEEEAKNYDLSVFFRSRNRNNNANNLNRNNLNDDVKNAIANSVELGDTPDFAMNNENKEIDDYLNSINANNANANNANNANANNNITADINIVDTEEVELKPLTVKEKFFLFIALNFYEALFGYIVAVLFTMTWFQAFGLNLADNFFDSFLKVLISITIISTILLFVREFVDTLPVIRNYKLRPGFYHPPPIALTFGLFRSIVPLGQRAKHVSDMITKAIGSKKPNPWISMDPGVLQDIKRTNPISFIIFSLIILGLLFGEKLIEYSSKLKNKLKNKFPDGYNSKKDYKNN